MFNQKSGKAHTNFGTSSFQLLGRGGATGEFDYRALTASSHWLNASHFLFRLWQSLQWHESHYQEWEKWTMFNVPSEVRARRFELTEEEADELHEEN